MKAIIFDFWGTIVENGVFPSPVKQVRYLLWLKEIPFSEYILKFEEAFMTKKFESLSNGFEEVCKAFKIQPDQYKIDKVVGLWNKNRLLAKPFPETMQTLEELKKKHKLVLIANIDNFTIEPLLEKFDLKKYFDGIFLSYETGKLKTNPDFFKDILKKLKLKEKNVVMVGDSLESDIIPAETAGIRAILLDRRGHREYKEKISSLEELKEILKK